MYHFGIYNELSVCHRPDGLEVSVTPEDIDSIVCHRPDGLEVAQDYSRCTLHVCHRPDGLEVNK